MKLITPDTIAFTAEISEAELRDRLRLPIPGVDVRIYRGASRKGGYRIYASGPAPARLRLPRPEETS